MQITTSEFPVYLVSHFFSFFSNNSPSFICLAFLVFFIFFPRIFVIFCWRIPYNRCLKHLGSLPIYLDWLSSIILFKVSLDLWWAQWVVWNVLRILSYVLYLWILFNFSILARSQPCSIQNNSPDPFWSLWFKS